jgi:hypothetical protein
LSTLFGCFRVSRVQALDLLQSLLGLLYGPFDATSNEHPMKVTVFLRPRPHYEQSLALKYVSSRRTQEFNYAAEIRGQIAAIAGSKP